ncbi:MAG: hypothetical protein LBE20_01580 [Deltaproteobacteria bacterium]|jgi:hypothetical protein|nr:hypothetical protein [Deltaproteobacteria bacterium]
MNLKLNLLAVFVVFSFPVLVLAQPPTTGHKYSLNTTPYLAKSLAKSTDSNNLNIISTAKFILFHDTNQALSVIKGANIQDVAQVYLNNLEVSANEVEQIFKYSPKQKIVLRLMPRYKFVRDLKAPRWANALYHNHEIIIPLDNGSKNIVKNNTTLQNTLRHEYTHALISEIAGEKCPAWLDEGLAQMLESKQNNLLAPALKNWLATNSSNLSIQKLSTGFINIDQQTASIAYAKSLYATKYLVAKHGMAKVLIFLKSLKNNTNEELAFKSAFGITLEEFSLALDKSLAQWFNADSNSI